MSKENIVVSESAEFGPDTTTMYLLLRRFYGPYHKKAHSSSSSLERTVK